jgi:hypothetical protein
LSRDDARPQEFCSTVGGKLHFAPSANGFAAWKNLSNPALIQPPAKFLRGFIQRE